MKNWLKKIYLKYNINDLRKDPLLWLYAAYLTLKYVDQFSQFPAIKFNSYVKVRFKKDVRSFLVVKKRLLFESFILNKERSTVIVLSENSKMIIEGDFILGDGISIVLSYDATLILKGKEIESASGITYGSIIMVNKHLEIGKDCIIAWDTYLTDCDWHSIDRKNPQLNTIIGDHVWIGVGVKVLKGASIGKNCIITSNSVVLKGTYPDQCLISGTPAKVIKTNIPMWNRDMNFDYA